MTTKYTPMMEQYLSVKATVPDAFLFFRLGDFYEMFFDDALLATKELEITLTGREAGAEARVPMCGVPHHAVETYIARLIEKGYKVAICEQVEDPAEAKGVVRREVVRIVTPGTLMDGKLLQEGANNYIACVATANGLFGFAACDISTGELHATSMAMPLEQLTDELSVFAPAELVAAAPVLELLKAQPAAGLRPYVSTAWDRQADAALFFGDERELAELERLGAASRQAALQLLGYLGETQKRSLSHITRIRRYEPNQYMTMDPFTRRNLELLETVRDRGKRGSLLWLLDETVTAMGARQLRKWIEKPLLSVARIEERLEAVETMYKQLIVRDDIRTQLKDMYDLERLVAKISYGTANGRDLLALKLSLRQLPELRAVCAESGSATLAALVAKLDDCADIAAWIDAAIVEEPPVSVRDGGIIKLGFHEHLDKLKEADRGGKKWLAELESREREATGIKSLKIGYNKVFGYYIEVTRANLGQLPEGRYERKQTLANAERFVTPELKEQEALILEAQEKMVDIEYGLFTELRERIAGEVHRLQQAASIVSAVDALQSLATVSAAHRFCRPAIGDGFDLRVVAGRHPVVEATLPQGAFIANDSSLGEKSGHVLLITGPNMAGKSTYMRQVAIICVMAQIGCFVPADEAELPLVDRIFTRIGAADDLIGGQSTFMVEMADIRVMTEKATDRSLVIIDELGRGTSTGEGMAIAQAVIEYLHDHIGCKTLVSTHFHELSGLETSLPHLRNARMAVKENDREVTFLRKLVPGAADTSYGIYCARIAGLPETIIERSYVLLGAFERRAVLAGGPASAGPAATEREQPLIVRETAAAKDAVQLSLFPDGADDANGGGNKARKMASRGEQQAAQLADQLRTADLINMTPMQAMNLLFDWKKKYSS
ncbi:MAG: DNA mismatch repair protein MutS [Paenibacillaceae bacterium]|nr:DNA mismatch repair protein MutS [Paenibacillaceae bacterium]